MHLLVIHHPRGKTSLCHGKHSAASSAIHTATGQREKMLHLSWRPNYKLCLPGIITHFLAAFWVSDQPAFKQQITVHADVALSPFRFGSRESACWLQPPRGSRQVDHLSPRSVLGSTWAPHWWSTPAACIASLLVGLHAPGQFIPQFPSWGIWVAGFCQTRTAAGWGGTVHIQTSCSTFPSQLFQPCAGWLS